MGEEDWELEVGLKTKIFEEILVFSERKKKLILSIKLQ
jgi:hypothetical protein